MSQIIDAMEKAKMLRKASESPNDGSNTRNTNYFRIMLLHVFGIFIGVIILYGCFRDSSPIDVKSISDKLDHIEKKIDLLTQNLSDVQKTTTAQNTVAAQETATAIKDSSAPAITSSQTADKKNEQYHIVLRGETLYSISKHYKITIDEIRRINRLKPTQTIKTGQKLLVAPDKNQQ
jgi:LysM repeat protein